MTAGQGQCQEPAWLGATGPVKNRYRAIEAAGYRADKDGWRIARFDGLWATAPLLRLPIAWSTAPVEPADLTFMISADLRITRFGKLVSTENPGGIGELRAEIRRLEIHQAKESPPILPESPRISLELRDPLRHP
jgi:hypothetical protein